MIDEEMIDQTTETPSNQEVETAVVEEKPKKRIKKKKSKARVITEWILTGIFGVIFIFVLAGQLDGMIHAKDHYNQQLRFGTGSFIVLTDSMEPEYPVNTAIVTYREKEEKIIERFKNGEIVDITFMHLKKFADVCPRDNINWQRPDTEVKPTGKPMTHRIFEIHYNEELDKYFYVTAGINVLKPGDEGYESDQNFRRIEQYQITDYEHILGVVKVNSPVLGKGFEIISSPIGLLIFLLIPALYLIITSSIDIIKALKTSEEAETSERDKPSSLDTLSDKEIERLKGEMLSEMIEKAKEGKNKDED